MGRQLVGQGKNTLPGVDLQAVTEFAEVEGTYLFQPVAELSGQGRLADAWLPNDPEYARALRVREPRLDFIEHPLTADEVGQVGLHLGLERYWSELFAEPGPLSGRFYLSNFEGLQQSRQRLTVPLRSVIQRQTTLHIQPLTARWIGAVRSCRP